MFNCLNTPCCSTYKGNYEEIRSFFTQEQAPFEVIAGQFQESRIRSKLAVRGTSKHPLLGLFKPGTHEVYEIPSCALHHHKINEAVCLIKQWIIKNCIEPYSEKGHTGLLRYIQCIVERDSQKVQISFVLKEKSPTFEQALKELSTVDFIHSLWINYNPDPRNTIFGTEWKLISGEQWIWETIGSIPVCYLPGSFGQANLTLFERLVDSIKRTIPSGKKIGEFYAGVGVIGLSVAQKSNAVILSEMNPESKICFDEMIKKLPQENVEYRLGRAEEALDILKEIDIAIVDPPRKGLENAFIQAINGSDLEMLVYVSCGWQAFVRDLGLLKAAGWKMVKAEGYPFFPGTPHLEILCFLSRVKQL
jgi:tRNA/tmRNA/rRNA uracil-C5-methylase (TrmA/RlmC/RlmD family)